PGTPGTLSSGVVEVVLEPIAVDAASRHEPGLFGSGTDERVHHTLSRLQSLLGHDGVLTATIGGGRTLAERQLLVPWGDRPQPSRPRDRPWPGRLPDPLPTTVYGQPQTVEVLGVDGTPVGITDRGMITSAPAAMTLGGRRLGIIGWAGP